MELVKINSTFPADIGVVGDVGFCCPSFVATSEDRLYVSAADADTGGMLLSWTNGTSLQSVQVSDQLSERSTAVQLGESLYYVASYYATPDEIGYELRKQSANEAPRWPHYPRELLTSLCNPI